MWNYVQIELQAQSSRMLLQTAAKLIKSDKSNSKLYLKKFVIEQT